MRLQGADKRARLAWVHAGRQPLAEQGRANSSPRSTATPWFLLLSFCSSDSSLVRHRPHSGAHRTADEAQSEEGNFAVILLGGDKIRTGHRCSNAAHLNHRLTLSTYHCGAWTLTRRARVALSAAYPCGSDSANTPRCKPSTARDVVWCSTFRRKPTFWKSRHLRLHEADEQLTVRGVLGERFVEVVRLLEQLRCLRATACCHCAHSCQEDRQHHQADFVAALNGAGPV